MSAQQHHHVSKFYLAGFTVEGADTGRLHVVDLVAGKTWESTPEKSARRRNHNRIEAEGIDPDAFELEVGKIETRAAAVIREVTRTLELPTGDALGDLIHFVALMCEHTQPRRKHWDDQEDRARRIALEYQIADPRGFEGIKARGRVRGLNVRNLTQEDLLDALDRSRVKFSSTWRVKRLIDAVNDAFPILMRRRWSLVRTALDAGECVCSDVPAVPHDPRPMPKGIGPALGSPEFTIPLSRELLLVGLRDKPAERDVAGPREVAILNGRAIQYAEHLYCSQEDFTWMRPDGAIGNRAELVARVTGTP